MLHAAAMAAKKKSSGRKYGPKAAKIVKEAMNDLKKGTLELVYESNKRSVLDEPDAIVVSPRGGVVHIEDGEGEDGGLN